jgi:hypothetical protein
MIQHAQAAASSLPVSAGRAGTPARALILRGDGVSASQIDEFEHAYPDHEVWSMNACYMPGASRHFDIHYDWDQPANVRACQRAREGGAQVVISPFRQARHAGDLTFPLEQIFLASGLALYQRTLCFMLALAVYEQRFGHAHFDVLCLPGHDFAVWPHFGVRDGPHVWLGAAAWLGLSIKTARGSSLLKRHLDPWQTPATAVHDVRADQPHCYGQPRSITAPLAARYRWE